MTVGMYIKKWLCLFHLKISVNWPFCIIILQIKIYIWTKVNSSYSMFIFPALLSDILPLDQEHYPDPQNFGILKVFKVFMVFGCFEVLTKENQKYFRCSKCSGCLGVLQFWQIEIKSLQSVPSVCGVWVFWSFGKGKSKVKVFSRFKVFLPYKCCSVFCWALRIRWTSHSCPIGPVLIWNFSDLIEFLRPFQN